MKKRYPEMDEQEKEEMWEDIAYTLALPKSTRPKNTELIEKYGVPESTFYWTTSRREFLEKIVRLALNDAKNAIPEVLEVLKRKAIVDGSEKSIEMYLKYVAETAEHIDHTTKGEKIIQSESTLDVLAAQMEQENKKKYE